MRLPINAWTWHELSVAHTRLADAENTAHELAFWSLSAKLASHREIVAAQMRVREQEMRRNATAQLSLVPPSAYDPPEELA